MTKVAILDDYQGVALGLADWSKLQPGTDVQVFRHHLGSDHEAVAALESFDVLCLMRERMPVGRALLERLPNLKLIVATGAHNRTLDGEAAKACGIEIAHTRGGESVHATPELAWALILACARSIPQEDRRMRAGGWQETVGLALHGRTLGILGLGRLGARMATIGRAFGMKLLAWSPNLTAEKAEAAGVTYADRETFFRAADILTIHMVLGEKTKGLIGRNELELMKRDAILVNTSRGPLVDEAELVEALQARRIRAAGLDVYDREPIAPDNPLLQLDNVVLSPHLGYVTEGTYRMFFEDTVDAIAAWQARRQEGNG